MTNPYYDVITFGQDLDYNKEITVRHNSTFTINQWREKYLTPEENAEWLKQHCIHEEVVQAAIAVSDCVYVRIDQYNVQMKWRNQEVHQKWMDTISQENRAVYFSYWDRYHAKLAELEQEKL